MKRTTLLAANKLIESIPSYALREELEGYLDSVVYACPNIFKEQNIKESDHLLSKFLFYAVVRKIWAKISAQNWLVYNSLETTKSSIKGYTVGRRDFSPGSNDYKEIRDFFKNFSTLLEKLDIKNFVEASSLSILLEQVVDERG